MPDSRPEFEQRLLILAPTRRDGEVAVQLLKRFQIESEVVRTIDSLCEELQKGAAAAVLTEEAILSPEITQLLKFVEHQPTWSDLPILMMMRGGAQSTAAQQVLTSLRNVILIDRPAPGAFVVSAAQSALRARRRQYQIRDQIDAARFAETRTRRLREQLAIAIDASQLGTFHCDFPLDRIIWNDRCKAHFWLPPEAEIDFDLFYSILHPDDREPTRRAIDDCVTLGLPYRVEYRTVSPSGKIRWIHASGKTYFDSSQRPIRFDGTTQDVTESKLHAEERQQLLDSERAARQEAERVSRMKDQFLATLSHELRTPLNAIFGWTQLLMMDKANLELVEEAVSVIDRNVRVQTQLIEDLLDVSRIVSGKIRLNIAPVELSDVIHAAIEGVKPSLTARAVRLEKVVDSSIGIVSGDSGRLQQVLWNLLTNAIKFTPAGGKVTVMAERVNSHVEISVTDTGAGIDPEFLPYLFDRFSQADGSITRAHGGLGLGLSIVKSLIELHGGTVRAESAGRGHGATFVLKLPMRVAKHRADDAAHPGEAAKEPLRGYEFHSLRQVKVLIVDDESDAREMLRRLLVEHEAVPAVAGSVAEALLQSTTFEPDILVSDIGMPGQDGYDLIREIRRRGVRIPAVALTAFARSEDRIRSLQAGYQAHLPKPVEPAELLATMARLLDRLNGDAATPSESKA
jgi:signal transduction histidine kinase/CheY-like chemotaxis protein